MNPSKNLKEDISTLIKPEYKGCLGGGYQWLIHESTYDEVKIFTNKILFDLADKSNNLFTLF